VLTQHLVSPLSLGDFSVHILRESSHNVCTEQLQESSRQLCTEQLQESSRQLCTEQSPKENDDSRCCTNTIVLLMMSKIVLETCRGV
jgi:hypothetical protein